MSAARIAHPAHRADPGFPLTQWDLVEAAAGPNQDTTALAQLLEMYLPVLETHIVGRFCLPADQAKDLLQSFLLDKVIQKNLLPSADRARGKFRNLLARSLHNYVVQELRRERASKRAPTNTAIPLHELPENHACTTRLPELDGFDVTWARGLLAETLRRMEEECRGGGRQDLWAVFEGRLLRPLLEDLPPVSYEDLMLQHGFQSAVQAANALITAKRVFARHLRVLVARYAGNEASIQSEITQLKEILLQVGAELPRASRNTL